jgi:1,4-alpha-glucan branching enzyme
MGGEFGQFAEWNYEQSLDWHLLDNAQNRGIKQLVTKLNQLYKDEPALHKNDNEVEGFEWIDETDYQANVIAFIRKGDKKDEDIIIVCNFSDHTREGYPIGISKKGEYEEIFNSQSPEYDGWDFTNKESLKTKQVKHHGRSHKLELTLPRIGVVYLKRMK